MPGRPVGRHGIAPLTRIIDERSARIQCSVMKGRSRSRNQPIRELDPLPAGVVVIEATDTTVGAEQLEVGEGLAKGAALRPDRELLEGAIPADTGGDLAGGGGAVADADADLLQALVVVGDELLAAGGEILDVPLVSWEAAVGVEACGLAE